MKSINEVTCKLENIDPEDIGDILEKLEKSFAISYRDNAFKEAKTFGDICDIIEAHINHSHQEDCTTQQAFYKVRKAISQTLQIEEQSISLDTELEQLFPRKNRVQMISELQNNLGLKLNILNMKGWLSTILVSIFILSWVALFLNWMIVVAGLIFFYMSTKIAARFSKELNIRTVKELTEKVARDHYIKVRRHQNTVNKNEVFNTIQSAFSTDLGLDKRLLTRDASLGWN